MATTNVRKLQENNANKTKFVTLPRNYLTTLGWKVGDILLVTKVGSRLELKKVEI